MILYLPAHARPPAGRCWPSRTGSRATSGRWGWSCSRCCAAFRPFGETPSERFTGVSILCGRRGRLCVWAPLCRSWLHLLRSEVWNLECERSWLLVPPAPVKFITENVTRLHIGANPSPILPTFALKNCPLSPPDSCRRRAARLLRIRGARLVLSLRVEQGPHPETAHPDTLQTVSTVLPPVYTLRTVRATVQPPPIQSRNVFEAPTLNLCVLFYSCVWRRCLLSCPSMCIIPSIVSRYQTSYPAATPWRRR